MKELSIEEKAKAYDEVLEQFKGFKPDERGLVLVCPSDLFPELAESEDERTRKEIATYLRSVVSNKGYSDETIESWIAWLEKQGKNNMGISEATKKKLEDNLDKALEKETPESWNKFLDEQGEQKPEWSEEDEKMLQVAISDTFDRAHLSVSDWLKSIKYRVEPSQKWSEEDTDMFGSILSTLSIYSNNPDIPVDVRKMHKKEYAWFDELYNRVLPQPKIEWSEDVEAAISLLKNIAEEQEKDYCPYNANNLRKAAQYLETCRPQSQWKPSDEQIKVLSDLIAYKERWESSHSLNILRELLDDLKKLRED